MALHPTSLGERVALTVLGAGAITAIVVALVVDEPGTWIVLLILPLMPAIMYLRFRLALRGKAPRD